MPAVSRLVQAVMYAAHAGLHPIRYKAATASLVQGFHAVQVEYMQVIYIQNPRF